MTPYGHVIYLNGASSSGKTTLARALQGVLPEPYYHLSVDAFAGMLIRRPGLGGVWDGDVVGPKFGRGFVGCVRAMARAGNNIVVDDVLCESYRYDGKVDALTGLDLLKQRVRALEPFSVLYVGVFCDLGELERRERARGDRSPGLARFQHGRVHAHSVYDVTVDTSRQRVAECASAVLRALARPPAPNAFSRLREGR